MGYSARKVSAAPVQCDHNDPHDAIDLEFLGLWLGMARLRDRVRRQCEGGSLPAKAGKRAARRPRARMA